MSDLANALDRLIATVAARKTDAPHGSYTAQLLAAGPTRAAKKLGEEGVETALAGACGSTEALVSESADLLYHLVVLWAARDLDPDSVGTELLRREGVSGLTEKARRDRPDAE